MTSARSRPQLVAHPLRHPQLGAPFDLPAPGPGARSRIEFERPRPQHGSRDLGDGRDGHLAVWATPVVIEVALMLVLLSFGGSLDRTVHGAAKKHKRGQPSVGETKQPPELSDPDKRFEAASSCRIARSSLGESGDWG